MDKEIIISRKSKKSIFTIKENNIPGKIKKIGILEFGFNNYIFNILFVNFISIKFLDGIEEYNKLDRGYYDIPNIISFFDNFNKNLKIKNKLKNYEYIKLFFSKATLKFEIRNNTNHDLLITKELSSFLKLPVIIKKNSNIFSYDYFMNIENRLLYVKCNNILYGEKINNNIINKTLLSHYITSNFGDRELVKCYKKIKYYDYNVNDNENFDCTISIVDENNKTIDYTGNSGIYIKLSLII